MRFIVKVCAAGLVAGVAQAQPVLTWTPMPRQWPIARLEAPMAYDSANQRVVVFGGYDHAYNRYNEVWEYYPAYQVWRNSTPSSGAAPVPRSGSTVAYDSARGRVLLFGGLDDARGYLGDTWEWDCNARTWTQVATSGTPGVNKPTPRQGVRMVYDAAGDRYVLFGGVDASQFFRDTWTFNPSTRTWSLLSTTTSSGNGRLLRGRTFHAMSFAGGPNRLFLFGGLGFDNDFPYPGGTGAVKNFEDVWELVGTVWTDRTPSGVQAGNQGGCATASACPGQAGYRPLAYDPLGNRLVTQGGWVEATASNLQASHAFSLASLTWSLVSSTIGGNVNASIRDSHDMVYAAVTSKLVLYGGYLSDVWELSGTTWTSPPAFNPLLTYNVYTYPRQDYHAMAWDSARGRLLALAAGAAEAWRLDPSAWSWSIGAVGSYTERVGQAAAYHSALDRLYMFGGRCKSIGVYQTQPNGVGATCGASGTLYNDLRAFSPGTNAWTQVTPAGGPPGVRWDHALVYDPVNNELVLFGGRDLAGNALSDTWVLSCSAATTCTWTAGGAGPSARYGHAMAFDLATSRVVLFGGQSGATLLGDVWSWNGATNTWTSVTPAGTAPSARVHPALAQADKVVPGLLMFGGRDAGGAKNDAWLLSGVGGGSPQWQAVTTAGAAPKARENAEMVYAPALDRVILYGGFDTAGLPASERGLMPGDLFQGTLVAKGDMDASGSTDLVLRSPSTSAPVIWTMSGINRSAELTASAALGASEQVVGVDDFDLDGRQDFVVWNSSTGAVTFWYMNGATRLSTGALAGAAPLATTWKLAATADFSHDGRPDLLWRNSSTQKLSIWTLSGATYLGAYAPNPDQAVDANWEVVGALDYNADGNTDLLWYNPNSGKIVFWFLDYNASRTAGQFANPANAGDNNWKVLAAGDFGVGAGGLAGTRDLVWRNETSGRFVVWYMDWAGNRTAGVFTNPMEPSPSPTLWTIVGPK